MWEDVLTTPGAAASGLGLMFLLVVADAFLIVVPGEIAVTGLGALAGASGAPPLVAVVAVATGAALVGDVACYLIGRRVGLRRWNWMRRPRARRAFAWARRRLDRGTAALLFTARFVPFARLAVNLTAGATGVPARRYVPLALCAAVGWAAYQAAIGAVVAAVIPGGPVVAVIVSVAVAVALGITIDAVSARRR